MSRLWNGIAAAGLAALLVPLTALAAPGGRTGFTLVPRAETPLFTLAAAPPGPPPAPPALRPNYRRAIVEMGVVAVVSTVRYWSLYHTWIEDWQYRLTFEDQFRRFLTTEAIRFDSNAFSVNFTHVVGGAFYYQFARTNHLRWSESVLAAFINSSVYEYVSEWREVISINDTLTTTFCGYAVGEPWFQLSEYFHHRKTFPFNVLAFMNPINEFNHWLDRKKPASKTFAEPGWTALEITAGWWRSSDTGRGTYDAARIGLDTQVIQVSGYGKPGTFKTTLRDTSFSEFAIDAVLRSRRPGDAGLKDGPGEEVDFFARTVGLASYRQKIDGTGRGYALSIGLGSAMTFVRKRPVTYDSRDVLATIDPLPETPTDFRDKLAVAHMAGPVIDWTRFGKGYKIRAVADAYLDFGMVNAFAFNAYSAALPITGLKSTLGYYGYTYAYGTSVSGRIDVEWRGFSLRGLGSGHVWNSWGGRDRLQANVTNDINALDTRTRFLVKAGWRPAHIPLKAFVSFERIGRWGRIGDIRASSRESRTSAGLSYLF
jgi:hypothetical protein